MSEPRYDPVADRTKETELGVPLLEKLGFSEISQTNQEDDVEYGSDLAAKTPMSHRAGGHRRDGISVRCLDIDKHEEHGHKGDFFSLTVGRHSGAKYAPVEAEFTQSDFGYELDKWLGAHPKNPRWCLNIFTRDGALHDWYLGNVKVFASLYRQGLWLPDPASFRSSRVFNWTGGAGQRRAFAFFSDKGRPHGTFRVWRPFDYLPKRWGSSR